MTLRGKVILKSGKDLHVRHGHPWVFSGAVGSVEGKPGAGALVEVATPAGKGLGIGFYSPASDIRVRIIGSEPPEDSFWTGRLKQAAQRRAILGLPSTDTAGYRLAYSESDGLPGLIVDVFGEVAVVQIDTPAADQAREEITAAIQALAPGVTAIFERSDADSRKREGLEVKVGFLAGKVEPGPVFFLEGGKEIITDPFQGQKTGAYLDLRPARLHWAPALKGRNILDLFAYAGSLSSLALSLSPEGRSTVVESGRRAGELARMQAERLGVADRQEIAGANAFEYLEAAGAGDQRFEAVILDPPRLASRKDHITGAVSALERLHKQAFLVIEDGGLCVSLCCTGMVSDGELWGAVERGAWKAGVRATILETYSQPGDHPVPLTFQEASYLRGFLMEVRRK